MCALLKQRKIFFKTEEKKCNGKERKEKRSQEQKKNIIKYKSTISIYLIVVGS